MSTTTFKITDYKNSDITFTRIANDTLWDKRLSWGARGLLAYVLSKPDKYDVTYADLKRNSPAKDKALKTILQELSDFGYLNINERVPGAKPDPSSKNKSGWNWRYQVFEMWRHNKLYREELEAKKKDREKSIETIDPNSVPVEEIGILPLSMDAPSMDASRGDIETTGLRETTKEVSQPPLEGVASLPQTKECEEKESEHTQALPFEVLTRYHRHITKPVSGYFYLKGVQIPKCYFDPSFIDNPCLFVGDVISKVLETGPVTKWYGYTTDETGTTVVLRKLFPNGLPVELIERFPIQVRESVHIEGIPF